MQLFEDVRLEPAPEGRTISPLLDAGDIDGFIAPRPPFGSAAQPHVGWLYDDPTAAVKMYFRATGIFPIMHILGVRRALPKPTRDCPPR